MGALRVPGALPVPRRAAGNVNYTGRKTLDAAGDDLRVQEVTSMRDGRVTYYTLAPMPGWTCDPMGAHAAVEETVGAIVRAHKRLVECRCAECTELAAGA